MNIVLFGAPGSGKGTQATVLASELNLQVISLGDILRQEVKNESELGKEVKNYMQKGLLVPDQLVARVIEEFISKTNGFILDGFPRTLGQAKTLDEIMQKQKTNIDAVLYFQVDEETIVSRLSNRRVCPDCGYNYHLKNMPPKQEGICDHCQTGLIQRMDDQPDVIIKRWQVFLKESEEIITFYRSKGNLISIDANGEKDDIFKLLKEKLQCKGLYPMKN